MSKAAARPSRLLLALLILTGALYVVFIARTSFRIGGQLHFTLIDDAMISMRYAQHLANGNGLVWNVGEAPIQGFTNPGWVLLMAALHRLPFTPATISLGIMTISGAILLLNMVVLCGIAGQLAPGARYAPWLAAMLAGLYFPLVFWSLRGMEVGILVLLIDTAVLQAVRLRQEDGSGSLILGLLLGAALVVRIDAVLAAALILLYTGTSKRMATSQFTALLIALGVLVFVILAAQAAYFGTALPNTYYQKLAGGSIVDRLRSGLLAFYYFAARDVLPPAVVAAAGIMAYPSLRTREGALLAGLLITQCLYSIWIGGDYAEPEVAAANRFITQGMPALLVLCALVLERAISRLVGAYHRSDHLVAAAAGISMMLAVSGTPWRSWAENGPPLWKADVRRARAGLAIAASTSPEATIAVHASGQIPYYSRRRAVDLLGLNDAIVAHGPRSTDFYPGHDKWNYDYSIEELRPDLIADNWIRLADYMRNRPDYRKLANGMYIRTDTTLVDEAALLSAYP